MSRDETKHSISVDSETELAPSGSSTPAPSGVESLPQLGDEAYARKGEIARGGLGRIVEATDKRLRRVVALKELRRHTPEAAARFVREALVTARLQHPGIVPIYEAGRWSDGEPFYAMKLVSGTSLNDAIAARPTLDDRLALIPRVIAVADTIAYAHGQRVIHRDLKPHNVMCGDFGETVVIDWGLAKDLAAPDEPVPRGESSGDGSESGHTVAGTVMGTPGYMPPEQAAGETVDERADVYALGAILYHVLAGAAPYKTAAVEGVLTGPPAPLDTLVSDVPRDLVAIVTKAMARELDERYPSAKEMAEDLRRFEAGKLVSVREYTPAERLWRWVRRHRAAVGIGAIATVALAVTGAVAIANVVSERDRANREAVVAHAARARAEARDNDLTFLQAKAQLDRDPTQTLSWLMQLADTRLDAGAASVGADAESRGVSAHVFRLDAGRIYGLALGTAGHGWALAQDGRLFAIDGAKTELAWNAGSPAIAFATTPDGATAAIGLAKSFALVSRGTPEVSPVDAAVISIAVDGKGDVALGLLDGRFMLRPRGGQPIVLERFGAEVRVVAFSPDGSLVAAAGFDGGLSIYRLADHKQVVHVAVPTQIWNATWAPDGSALATASEDGNARIFTLDGAPPTVLSGHKRAVMKVAFDASGKRLATASRDHAVKLWSRDGKLVATLAHDDEVYSVVALRDGWASAGNDHVIRRWDGEGAAIATWRGHPDFIPLLAVSPDGELIASGGQDGTLRMWRTALDRDVVVSHATALSLDRVTGAIASVQGGHVFVGSADRGATDGTERLAIVDDKVVLAFGPRARITRHTDAGATTLVPPPNVELGGATEQGGVVLAAGYDGKLWRWPSLAGAPIGVPGDAAYVLSIARVPASDLVITGGTDGKLTVWHIDGRVETKLAGGDGPVHHLAASPDGKLVAMGDGNGNVAVWNVGDWRERIRYRHTGVIQGLAFSPASDRIVSAGDDRNVFVHGVDGSSATLTGHVQVVTAVAISHDGKLVAAGAVDGSVRIWDLATGASRTVRGHRAAVRALAFERTGGLLTGGNDGAVIRWPSAAIAPPPATAAELRAWIAARTDATVSP